MSETFSFVNAKAKSIREILDKEKYDVDVFSKRIFMAKKTN